jgi:hypothetical protein
MRYFETANGEFFFEILMKYYRDLLQWNKTLD